MNHQVDPAERFHGAFHPLPVRKACRKELKSLRKQL